jgi:2Fe-2S ferredoxin
MPKIQVLPHESLCPEGKTFEVSEGTMLCRSLLDHGIEIEHACEMSRACTTCHCIVRQGFESLAAADDDEEDLLDKAWGLAPTSRLSCQVKLGAEDLVVEIPRYTINHAKESH